jgi:hypothetical protein
MNAKNLAAAQAILDQQSRPAWGVPEHIALISNICLAAFESEQGELDADERKAVKAAIRRAIADDGVAGNASQFRQLLVKEGKLPKSDAAVASYE